MTLAAFVFTLAVGLGAAPQPPPPPVVPPNTPYDVAWDHDGSLGASFRLWVDGAIAKNFTAADLTRTGNTWRAAGVLFTPTQIGPHTIGVSAYNTVADSGPLTIPIRVDYTSAPPAPTNFTITVKIQVANGRIVTIDVAQDPPATPPLAVVVK